MRTQLVMIAIAAAAASSIAAGAPRHTNPDTTTPAPVFEAAVVDTTASLVDAAVAALDAAVSSRSHPDAPRMAFQAYYRYRSANDVRNPYFYFVDYGLDNRTPRGYLFDMDALTLVEGPFIVAHGRGSSIGKHAVPTRFSNRPGSETTSLGLFVAAQTYGFSGKSGGHHYTSVGLRLDGVSGRFNDNARDRGIVVHGAPYVTASGAGRSEGCPAMEPGRAKRLIPKIANGGLVFLFSPRDRNWMQEDPWING